MHDKILHQVLSHLSANDFHINAEKCTFVMPKILFLGQIIQKGTVTPDTKKITAISKISMPKTLKQVQSFLGPVNYYSEYISNLTSRGETLQELFLSWTDNLRSTVTPDHKKIQAISKISMPKTLKKVQSFFWA